MSSLKKDARRNLIMIVDDDELMQIFYERAFTRYASEFNWQLKSDAEEALEHLRESDVDAAILDWDLPAINGLQLLKAIRASPATRRLPVIMVTGRTSPDYQALAMRHGASAYLPKPFEVDKLISLLRELLAKQ